MKASAGKWIECGNGSAIWGTACFPSLTPLSPSLSLSLPSCEEEVALWEGCGGRGGGGVMSQYRHMILHHCVCFRPPSSSCWASASCQRAGQAAPLLRTAGRFRPLHATAWETAAARGMQGLVPPAVPDTSVCCSPPAEVGSRSDVQQLFFSRTEPLPPLAVIPSVVGY